LKASADLLAKSLSSESLSPLRSMMPLLVMGEIKKKRTSQWELTPLSPSRAYRLITKRGARYVMDSKECGAEGPTRATVLRGFGHVIQTLLRPQGQGSSGTTREISQSGAMDTPSDPHGCSRNHARHTGLWLSQTSPENIRHSRPVRNAMSRGNDQHKASYHGWHYLSRSSLTLIRVSLVGRCCIWTSLCIPQGPLPCPLDLRSNPVTTARSGRKYSLVRIMTFFSSINQEHKTQRELDLPSARPDSVMIIGWNWFLYRFKSMQKRKVAETRSWSEAEHDNLSGGLSHKQGAFLEDRFLGEH
ncbi:hypothetical protein KCU62_g242, partial [Aureobasidium sp. EXF-3399]